MMVVDIRIGLVLALIIHNRLTRADSLALRPWSTETRLAIRLDGVWNFRLTNYSLPQDYGFIHQWYNKSLDLIDQNYERMPVPASFNDITQSRLIRDFQGWSWYDRHFFTPPKFDHHRQRILLRFDSVNYETVVHLNGQHAMNHTGGHLPFETDITELLRPERNHISVAVNNRLTNGTLPPGKFMLKQDSRNVTFAELEPNFDFFPYAGIQRSVWMMVVPAVRITDLTVWTEITGNDGVVYYRVDINAANDNGKSKYLIEVAVFDRGEHRINQTRTAMVGGQIEGSIVISSVHKWWPFTMDPDPGYLYRMTITVYNVTTNGDEMQLVDRYHQTVGIRTIRIANGRFLINERPFYFRGFGRHEEYDVRGRSLDPVMIQKDFNLIKWIGANSFRTSHYPYSEEMMDEADRQGIVIIDECPAVGLKQFTSVLMGQHIRSMAEMIERDKNRPSVVMWSVANEAASNHKDSKEYFERVCREARKLNAVGQRPITAAINQYKGDNLSPLLDVVMVNYYAGWYHQTGYPQTIQQDVAEIIRGFAARYRGKPVMISEYGADSVSGLHMEPAFVFTEDYQVELMMEHHRTFDLLRNNKTAMMMQSSFIGEHVWNFADFMTAQTVQRVGGNKKGMFTRQRQPKSAARLLRCRYWAIANAERHVIDDNHQQGFSYCPVINY